MTEADDKLRILKAIPLERLSTYGQAGESNLDTLILKYFLNIRLTEALYPSLACLEITLRNHIHAEATAFYGESWLEIPHFLHPREAEKFQTAKTELQKAGKPLTTGRIIAELPFGFWTSLFLPRYEQKLWNKLTKKVFAFAPKQEQYRKKLFGYC